MSLYTVHSYYTSIGGVTKTNKGNYISVEEAVARQRALIPIGKTGINGSYSGKDKDGCHITTFVNIFKMGDDDTVIHTTPLPNWHRYS
jgi:hypothetical protein